MITSEKMRLFGKQRMEESVTYTLAEYQEIHISIQVLEERDRRYSELLLAVVCKHEGETRHETALRYIQERESPLLDEKQSASTKE